MIWAIEFDDRARKELRKLGAGAQRQILKYLRTRIATDQDPRRLDSSSDPEQRRLLTNVQFELGVDPR